MFYYWILFKNGFAGEYAFTLNDIEIFKLSAYEIFGEDKIEKIEYMGEIQNDIRVNKHDCT